MLFLFLLDGELLFLYEFISCHLITFSKTNKLIINLFELLVTSILIVISN